MERAVVLTQGGGQPQASPALGDLVAQYSTILASQVNLPPILISPLCQLCINIATCVSWHHLVAVSKRISDPQIVSSALTSCSDMVSVTVKCKVSDIEHASYQVLTESDVHKLDLNHFICDAQNKPVWRQPTCFANT